MRWIAIFSSVCVGIFIVACGVMWSLGVFSGLGAHAVMGVIFGIFFATAIGTALMALASFSEQSGHDVSVFHAVNSESGSQDSKGAPRK